MKVVKSKISSEELEERAETSGHGRQFEMLAEFMTMNNISPADSITIFSNVLIWICEDHFNKQIFDAVIEAMQNGWDKNRQ